MKMKNNQQKFRQDYTWDRPRLSPSRVNDILRLHRYDTHLMGFRKWWWHNRIHDL